MSHLRILGADITKKHFSDFKAEIGDSYGSLVTREQDKPMLKTVEEALKIGLYGCMLHFSF
jgi:hypothetical protein